MTYGSDITEELPYSLSNPGSAKTFDLTGIAYDISIDGKPFFLQSSDETPYRRSTAPYRKQQIDQSKEPGEQTLTGWWVRSQSSFHCGAGIKFYDPSAGESIGFRFYDSQGLDIWTKGTISLLHDTSRGHNITASLNSNGTPAQHTRTITWGSTQGVLLHDGYDVDKVDSSGTVTHFIDYNSGTSEPVYAVCDDGVNAYWVTNAVSGGSNKMHMYKKPLSGDTTTGVSYPSATGDVTLMFNATGVVITNATMEWVKDRIVLCINNSVYEIAPNATSLPTAVYINPNTSYVYTSIAASGPAIYTSGFSGLSSTVQKYTLSTTGTMPTLSSASVAAELPVGEKLYKIYYYLGLMMMGTSRGIRAALVNDQDGSLTYGPLIVETNQACFDFAARDRFVWCATSVNGDAGLIRLDLGQPIEGETLRFAYANDLQYVGDDSGRPTTGVAFLGSSNQLAFSTSANGATVGYVYIEHPTTLRSSGYLTTGKIRYSTLEGKIFKFLKPRVDNSNGAITSAVIDSEENTYVIGNFTQGDFTSELGISYPIGAQEYLSFQFTLTRSSTDTTKGAVLNGYQIKSLPAVPRQRLIEYPLMCYDTEKDKNGVSTGYEGRTYDRIFELEAIENVGDSIKVIDFRTNESYSGIIEQMEFINRTSTDKRFSGYGGVILIQIRTL